MVGESTTPMLDMKGVTMAFIFERGGKD